MSKKTHYYGLKDAEYYYHDDIDSAYEEIRDYYYEGDEKECISVEIVEMVKSKKSGVRWCEYDKEFIEFTSDCCGKDCLGYKPRNGKNGICKYLSWSLIETGCKWIITGDYEYKKISGRRIR